MSVAEGFGGAFGAASAEEAVSERDQAIDHEHLRKLRAELPVQAIVAGHAVLFEDGTASFLPVEADWPYAGPDLREPGA